MPARRRWTRATTRSCRRPSTCSACATRRGRSTARSPRSAQLEVEPGAVNVIPGRVRLTVDARAPDEERLARLLDALDLDPGVDLAPVQLDDSIRSVLREEIERVAAPAVELPSGAGHDAGVLAAAGVETGMLFVRSLNGGVSHSPEELTSEDDIAKAVEVLTATLRRLSARVKEISCAPSQSVRRPSSRRCSCPSTIVAKWLPASGPALLANAQCAVREEQLRLADAARVEQQLARGRVARRVLRPDAELEVAERDPVRLAAPAAVDDLRRRAGAGAGRPRRSAGAASSSKRATKRKSRGGDLDHGSTLAPCAIQRPRSSRSASVISVTFPSGIARRVRTACSSIAAARALDLLRRVEHDPRRRGRERRVRRRASSGRRRSAARRSPRPARTAPPRCRAGSASSGRIAIAIASTASARGRRDPPDRPAAVPEVEEEADPRADEHQRDEHEPAVRRARRRTGSASPSIAKHDRQRQVVVVHRALLAA